VEKVMTFSRGLFQEAFHALSVNRAIAFTFLAAQVALQIFEEKLGHGGSGVQFFLFCILAICIHQAVIKPDFSVPNFTQRSMMWGYGWRLLVMLLLCGAMGYFLASLVPLPPEAKFVFIALAVIMVAILYALVLSMWGTALPAVAVSGDAGFAGATARGKKTFGYSALRLLFCCGPLLIAEFALIFFVISKFSAADGNILGGPLGVNVTPLLVGIIISLFGLFNTSLASTILSRAYLIGERNIGGAGR
jgi:hypothetical protein